MGSENFIAGVGNIVSDLRNLQFRVSACRALSVELSAFLDQG